MHTISQNDSLEQSLIKLMNSILKFTNFYKVDNIKYSNLLLFYNVRSKIGNHKIQLKIQNVLVVHLLLLNLIVP